MLAELSCFVLYLLFQTHDNHFTGEKSVPTPLSCTSVLQTWTKDTGDSLQGIRPEPIDQLVVRKPKYLGFPLEDNTVEFELIYIKSFTLLLCLAEENQYLYP
ncbi:unnamed protein product [Gadus morhua 'NCC']